ncbi:outer membrane protein [Prolixibacter denitrificans]|uniref:Outer membrane protein with beta-barrel domain n=1 Tax=Prolixibacter denitrificans TaxID=1541063 RepID=A0A2P8C7Q0_9BACT|nr:outer membrane beta-barrel protein [Prolixibacter denitrificans]PSK80966.1 outer membrane protein with beta-barrel domain [Prolixibacter denitrificans]GET22366.1 hypothetical protein JCM18694_26120 [Prolixibacter denitrificans]
MKKSAFLVLAIILPLFGFSQSFDTSNLRVGGGLVYGTDIDNVGIDINGVYQFNEQWEGGIAFTHFFEKNYANWNVLDFDGHYIFYSDNSGLNVYGAAGLSVTFAKIDIPGTTYTDPNFGTITTPGVTASDSNLGLNIGAGVNYALTDQLNLAPELKVTIANGSYVRMCVNLQYRF